LLIRSKQQEKERAAAEEEEREKDIALGNPLLNKVDFNIKRRWDDDVVFKNQARGTDDKGKKEFVNVSSHKCTLICFKLWSTNLSLGSPPVGLPQAVHEQVR